MELVARAGVFERATQRSQAVGGRHADAIAQLFEEGFVTQREIQIHY